MGGQYGSYDRTVISTRLDDDAKAVLLEHDEPLGVTNIWTLHEPFCITRLGIMCLNEAFTTPTTPGVIKLIKTFDRYSSGNKHDGGASQSSMTDSSRSFTADEFIGRTIFNLTDGSQGTITDNTATNITATLAGGTDNDWDDDDIYIVGDEVAQLTLPDEAAVIGSIFFVNVNDDRVYTGDKRNRGDVYAGEEVLIAVTTAGVSGAGQFEPFFAGHHMAETAANMSLVTHNEDDE